MKSCPHYKIDTAAKAAYDDEYKVWYDSLSSIDREAYHLCLAMEAATEDLDIDNEDEDTSAYCKECKEFCAYLREGPGMPGESVIFCSAPDNEHTIEVDFNINAII